MSKKPLTWKEWLSGGRPVNRFSLEELQRLHNELMKQTKLHKTRRGRSGTSAADQRPAVASSLHGNKETFVETLRSIAELMIWGEQHEPRFFDFFLEKNVLLEFYEILSSPENRTGEIATQVLQTLSIMILNIKRETSIFYLFSNNHLNNILQLDFDFSDEELTPRTIHFFFQKAEDGVGSSFPLYTEAIRFVGNKEGMVRAAVRTLTLNVYSVEDDDLQEFVVSKPASNYFTELALYAAEQCQALDRLLLEAENAIADSYGELDSQMNRIEDLLSYFNDIFVTGAEVLCSRLASCLWEYFVGPALLWPLLEVGSRPCLSSSYGLSQTGVFRAVSSLCIIERLFHVLESPILCEPIVCCLLAGDSCFSDVCKKATTRMCVLRPTAPFHSIATPDVSDDDLHRSEGDMQARLQASVQRTPREATSLRGLFVRYRESFLRCLSGDSTQIGTAAVRVLVSMMLHPGLDPDVFDVCGILPVRSRIRRNLINELAGQEEVEESPPQPSQSSLNPSPRPSTRPSSRNSVISIEEQPTNRRISANPLRFIRNLNQKHNKRESRTSPEVEEMLEEKNPPSPMKLPKSEELMNALIQLTMLPTLPPMTISYINWIFSQLTTPNTLRSSPQNDPEMHWIAGSITEACIESVGTALVVCQTSVADEIRGIWCDALVYLIQQQWSKSKQHATEPRIICTSTSLLDSIFAQKASELGSALYNARGSVTSQQLAVRLRLCLSAQCALHVFFKIKRLVALTQLKELLLDGRISDASGLPHVSPSHLKSSELKEGVTLGLVSTTVIPCTVAFVQGQERAAYYCAQGLPNRAMSSESDEMDEGVDGIAEVAQSVPSVVLASPSPNRINIGTVLSAAPLVGSEPRVDQQHESWLHLRVRPSIQRFLGCAEKAGTLNQPPWTSFRQLYDGHWVLAFHNPGEALRAKYMTQDYLSKLSALYCNVLSPVLTNETPTCNGHPT